MSVLLNGNEYGFSDCEISVSGSGGQLIRYGGIAELTYKHSRDVEPARGSESYPLGLPRGKYNGVEGSFKILRRFYNQMISDAGDGYMEINFDLSVTCGPKGQPASTDECRTCTVTNEDFSKQDDGESEYVTREFKGLMLIVNGLRPVL